MTPISDNSIDYGEHETPAERDQRLEREAAMIEEALASVEAGRTVTHARVKAWIASIGTANEHPVPQSNN